MRRLLLILCAVVLVVACLGSLIFWHSNRREKPLPDGSIIRIEKVAYGHKEHIALAGPFEKIKAAVQKFWWSKFPRSRPPTIAGSSSWWMNTIIHSNDPALYIYISRRAPGNSYRSVDAQSAQLIDEDGCVFSATQSGGFDDGLLSAPRNGGGGTGYSVGWFRFEAFPRHDKKFRFRVYETQTWISPGPKAGLAEFSIANPAPPPKSANWPVEPLPITLKQDNVTFILAKVAVRTDQVGYPQPDSSFKYLSTTFQTTEDGQLSTNWQALNKELYDSSGDFVAQQYGPLPPLCPRESSWKLRVKFFGSEKSRAASNAVWTITNLAVPAPGKYTVIDQSRELQGVPVKVGTFGGPGDFTYSNAITLHSEIHGGPIGNNSSTISSWPKNWTGKSSIAKPTFSLQTRQPYLAIQIGDLNEDQRLTVRAVDDQGREFYGHKINYGNNDPESGPDSPALHYIESWYESEGDFVILDLPKDAKTVDLSFCIHTCRTAEFIFKPPPPAATSLK